MLMGKLRNSLFAERANVLSPLYDLNNQAAFAVNYKNVKPRMAMAIGRDRDAPDKGEFWRTRVTRDHWADFAKDVGMPAAHVLKKLDEMTTRISAAVTTLREEFRHTLADTLYWMSSWRTLWAALTQ